MASIGAHFTEKSRSAFCYAWWWWWGGMVSCDPLTSMPSRLTLARNVYKYLVSYEGTAHDKLQYKTLFEPRQSVVI